MPLTANRDLVFYTTRELCEVPVDLNAVIYKGALVGRNRATGYARPLTLGDEYVGIAYRQAANNFAGAIAGGISVRLQQDVDVIHTLTGVAQADIGKEVFALDDSTMTLQASNATRIGRIVAVEGSNLARIRSQPLFELTGTLEGYPIAALADSTQTLTLDHLNRVLLMPNNAARTLTLPAVATARAGAWIRIVKTSAAAFAITIDPNAAELIDGAATLATIDAQYDAAHIVCTGSEWIVLARDIT